MARLTIDDGITLRRAGAVYALQRLGLGCLLVTACGLVFAQQFGFAVALLVSAWGSGALLRRWRHRA